MALPIRPGPSLIEKLLFFGQGQRRNFDFEIPPDPPELAASWMSQCDFRPSRQILATALIPAFFAVFVPAVAPADAAPQQGGTAVHSTALVQYQSIAAPVFVPTAATLPDLSWAPKYPDRLSRPPQPQADSFFYVTARAELPVPLSWESTYPDRVPKPLSAYQGIPDATAAVRADAAPSADKAPQQGGPAVFSTATVQYQGTAAPVFVSAGAPAVPPLSWAPVYPSRLPPWPTFQPDAAVYVPALAQLPVPSMAWAPSYPSRLTSRPASQPDAAVYAHALPQLPVALLSWEGTWPERIASRAASQQSAVDSTAALRADPPAPAPPLSWAPTYPSRISIRVQTLGYADVTPALRADPPRELQEAPQQGGTLVSSRTLVQYQNLATPVLPQAGGAPAVPPLSWAPQGVIVLVENVVIQYQGVAGPVVVEAPTFPRSLYPERTFALPGLHPSRQQSLAFVQVTAPAVVTPLSWAAVYQERALRLPPAQRGHQDAVAALRADPLVPVLAWKAIYPERVAALPGRGLWFHASRQQHLAFVRDFAVVGDITCTLSHTLGRLTLLGQGLVVDLSGGGGGGHFTSPKAEPPQALQVIHGRLRRTLGPLTLDAKATVFYDEDDLFTLAILFLLIEEGEPKP